MAAFGQLGAGIAHEVKNPLTGILACSQLAAEEADEGSQVQQDLRLIEKEARRCKAIIDNLLKFARQEKAEMKPIEVNAAVEDAIAIVNHQMEINQVRVEQALGADLPQVVGNAPRRGRLFPIRGDLAMSAAPDQGHTAGTRSIGELPWIWAVP